MAARKNRSQTKRSQTKVSTRLALSFGLIVVSMGVIGGVGVVNMLSLRDSVDDMALDKYPKTVWVKQASDATKSIAVAIRNLAVFDNARLRSEELASITASEQTMIDSIGKLGETIASERGRSILTEVQQAERAFLSDTQRYVDLIESGRADEAKAMLARRIPASQEAYLNALASLTQYQSELMEQAGTAANHRAGAATAAIIAVGILALLVTLGIAIWLTRSLLRQLGGEPDYAAACVNEMANGNVDAPIKLRQGDDSSLLASLKGMQDVLQGFVTGQRDLARQHSEGWIWETMDRDRYPGTFGDMAEEINELLRGHIDTKMKIVEVITSYSKGDFSVDIPELPGDKAKITEAVGGVKAGLVGVSEQIKTVAAAGANGDFTKRADTEDYDFIFRAMLDDLNRLMENCEVGFGDVMRVSSAIAAGDLTQTITKDYPGAFGATKVKINETVAALRDLAQQIKQSADAVTVASREISSGNQDLSQRTEQQATSLQETAASMEELTATVKQNAANAGQANQLAVAASDVAERGGDVVRSSVATMHDIAEFSKKMADIINVIDGIAFQTNILALNAAVEAARAGDQGRGFAVVASEVRNLAQRTGNAAKEINALITESVDKVDSGTTLIGEAGSRMDEIVESIKRVTDLMGEISAASNEQSAGIDQVNQATAEMEDVAQQNAALVEQASAAADSLDEQAHRLVEAVAVFKLEEAGQAGADVPRLERTPSAGAKPVPLKRQEAHEKHGANVRSIITPAKRLPRQVAAAEAAQAEWVEF